VHKLVAAALARSPDRISLATLGGRKGVAITLGYLDSAKWPAWVAKVAHTSEAVLELAKEHQALLALAPWAEELGVPRVLDWQCDSTNACLLTSAVAGRLVRIIFRLAGEPGSGSEHLNAALSWLERFRRTIPAGGGGPAREAAIAALAPLKEECGAVAGLRSLLESAAEFAAAPSHGDFWYGNLRFDGKRAGVFDWSGLAARSPLHDIFKLLTSCCFEYGGAVKTPPDVAAFGSIWFSATPLARYFREKIRPVSDDQAELRTAFYHFLAESILIAGPSTRGIWYKITSILERRGFPAPGSLLPAGIWT
jgi:hypothetical protein